MEQDEIQKINDRISKNPELEPYREVLLYDWDEADHADWVATAPIAEIIDWAETVSAP